MYNDLKRELNRLRTINNDEPTKLYHYCDSTGLLGILKGQKLWATHAFYLNDTSEINYTHELIENIYRELLENSELNDKENNDHQRSYRGLLHRLSYKTLRPKPNNDIYIVCFCEHKDLLSQWRGYGNKGAGYAVGFETDKLKTTDSDFKLYKILYCEKKQKEILVAMIDSVITSYKKLIVGKNQDQREKIADEHIQIFEKEIVSLATYFKHPSFSEEEEWRLVFDSGSNHSLKEIKFRASINGIIPYVEYVAYFEEDKGNQLLPINEVWLGPTVMQEAAIKSIKMIADNLYSELDVRGSNIPFR